MQRNSANGGTKEGARLRRTPFNSEHKMLVEMENRVQHERAADKGASLFTAAATPKTKRAEEWLKSRVQRSRVSGRFTEDGTLTPELAELLLAINVGNRPQRSSRVRKFAEMMREGRWLLTHQGVAITADGILVDGQHRCLACVDAGVEVPMHFAFGCDPATFRVLDSGESRKALDSLAIAGHQCVTQLATCATLVNQIEHQAIRHGASRFALPNDQIEAFVDARPQLHDAVLLGGVLYRAFPRTSLSAYAAAAYFILQKHPESVVRAFVEAVRDGLNLSSKRDPIYLLRKEIQDRWSYGTRGRGPRTLLSAAVVKAFNAWVRGKQGGSLGMKPEEQFPDVAA